MVHTVYMQNCAVSF